MSSWLLALACLLSAPGNFEPLFDGTSLSGWEGDPAWFRVADGAIVAGTIEKAIPRNAFLCTTEEYADFELRLDVKLVGENANAGIQFRSARIPDHHEVIGYQADMGEGWWGALYDESRRNCVLAQNDKKAIQATLRAEEWNEYIIRAEGPRIRLWINGLLTADWTEEDTDIASAGIIGLQIHSGPPSEAAYRNIRIMRLNSPPE